MENNKITVSSKEYVTEKCCENVSLNVRHSTEDNYVLGEWVTEITPR